MRSKSILSTLIVLVAALALAACGSSNSSKSSSTSQSSTPKVAKDPKVAALVPAAVKSKGTLVVATDPTYPPVESTDPKTKKIVGLDPDIGDALGKLMGVKLKFQTAGFDSIIAGLGSKKYDLAMSAMTDNKEREKAVDFVTYFSAGTSFYVKAQGGPAITGLASLCGHKVAAEKGTTQVTDAQGQAKKCGSKKLQVQTYPDQNGANLALSSGRADVGMADSPVVAKIVKDSNGQFKQVGKTYGTAPYGIAVPKGSGMTKPLLAGMKALIKNGAYKAIITKWAVPNGAITTPTINGATS